MTEASIHGGMCQDDVITYVKAFLRWFKKSDPDRTGAWIKHRISVAMVLWSQFLHDNELQQGAESQGNGPGDDRRWLLELETSIEAKLKAGIGSHQIYVYFWEGGIANRPWTCRVKMAVLASRVQSRLVYISWSGTNNHKSYE
ncbi:hypothetical protein EMCG_02344 [[Emmonsia] crescens]|uniref:Uncharacterized protein n=1 Tax=[Emmonsia] crescens TaxID=73230 RepID=A0A0G2HYZ1_9EURO|nr:hypothetical protein EMCG_02344 [Emmonsia crescens UAMH 3008]